MTARTGWSTFVPPESLGKSQSCFRSQERLSVPPGWRARTLMGERPGRGRSESSVLRCEAGKLRHVGMAKPDRRARRPRCGVKTTPLKEDEVEEGYVLTCQARGRNTGRRSAFCYDELSRLIRKATVLVRGSGGATIVGFVTRRCGWGYQPSGENRLRLTMASVCRLPKRFRQASGQPATGMAERGAQRFADSQFRRRWSVASAAVTTAPAPSSPVFAARSANRREAVDTCLAGERPPKTQSWVDETTPNTPRLPVGKQLCGPP